MVPHEGYVLKGRRITPTIEKKIELIPKTCTKPLLLSPPKLFAVLVTPKGAT